jgi:hypothetical protein
MKKGGSHAGTESEKLAESKEGVSRSAPLRENGKHLRRMA